MYCSFRTTSIFFFIAVGLSVYTYIFEQGRPPWESTAFFSDIGQNDIVELVITPGPGEISPDLEAKGGSIVLRYEKSLTDGLPEWKITSPLNYPAFEPRVEGVLLSILELERIVPMDGVDTAGPMTKILFKTRGPVPREHVIEVGQDHPDSSIGLSYFRIDGKVAFWSKKRFKKSFNVSLDDLRSRSIFPVTKENAIEMQIIRPGNPDLLVSRKRGTQKWYIEKPFRGVVNQNMFTLLLDKLNSWRVNSFITDDLKDPRLYGFNEPRLTLILTHRGGEEYRYEIVDGPQGEPGKAAEVFLRDPEKPFVYSATGNILADLEKLPEEFRSRYLLQLSASDIIEVEGDIDQGRKKDQGGKKHHFRLWQDKNAEDARTDSKAKSEDYHWKVTDGVSNVETDADSLIARKFIDQIRFLEVRRYLDSPRDSAVDKILKTEESIVVSLNLKIESERPIRLDFHPTPQNDEYPGGSYLVTYDGGSSIESEQVTLITTEIPKILESGGVYFRARALSNFSSNDILKLTIESTAYRKAWTLARIGRSWVLGEDNIVQQDPGKPLDQLLVHKAVSHLSEESFRVNEYLPGEKDFEKLELTQGRFQIRIQLKLQIENPGFQELIIGAQRARVIGPEYYARVDTIQMPILISQSFVEDFQELIKHLDKIIIK